jgi:hypothetical protein
VATMVVQVQVVLRLQAAAHDFVAWRRLQKAYKQMQDREAVLAAVAFAFDAEWYATSTRSMATNNCVDQLLCPRVRMVSFP